MIKLKVVLPFGLVVLVFVIYVIFLINFIRPAENFSLANSGLFGDSFGILTSLFSGLAFAGLLVTILYQKEQLDEQRRELASGSKLMALSALLNSSKLLLFELERTYPGRPSPEISAEKEKLNGTINTCKDELIATLKKYGVKGEDL